jgi:DNA-binding NtrC family response regulator
MTRSRNKSSKDFSRNLSQKETLQQQLAGVLNYSKRLMQDNDLLGQEESAADIAKINALVEKLSKIVDDFSEMSGDMVHDLRTPLNGIIGYSEMLLEDCDVEVPDLQKVLSAARGFQKALETMVSCGATETINVECEADATSRDAMIQGTMDSLSSMEGHQILPETIIRASILVVDDNEINRDLFSSHLGRQGHKVILATNGREALEISANEPVDLILLDIMMPEMNGFEVLEHLKSNPNMENIPVIVISALDTIASAVRCIQMGAEDYLLKPFNPVLLKARLNSCLEKKRLKELSEALELRNLKEEVQFIAESKVMQNILNTVFTVSRNPINILLHGNSGTGKEVIARVIHNRSDRKKRPFVAVNCASIPENLMESEFFGYEKGAFTGADSGRGGYFEEADGGTLFLDEIGDMPMFIQPKFMRVLQEGEGRRLGSSKSFNYDLRIISATNKDLLQEVDAGRFRKDLFYRIFSVEINIPPLKDRREDIVPLALFFLNKVSKRFGKRVAGFAPDILRFFEQYSWPGNVRQLQHEVERLVAFTPEGKEILLKYCSQELLGRKNPPAITSLDDATLSLPDKIKELEINCINEALSKTGGKKMPAAKLLGITRVGLDNKIKRYGIDPSHLPATP